MTVKLFLKKALLFVGLPLLVLSSLQFFADRGLRRSCSFLYTEWNDLVNGRINADLLVLGSSRAWVHVSPRVLDSSFHLNSYNLGLDGYNFLMQNYRFKLYLEHNKKPAYIIQTLETNSLARRTTLLNYQQFIPYLNEPLVREAVGYYKGMDFKDMYIPGYKYRSDADTAMLGLRTYFSGDQGACVNTKYKGFLSSDESWDGEFERFVAGHPKGIREKVDSLTLHRFDAFLSFCAAQKIRVILVYPPEYHGIRPYILNRDSIIGIYSSFATRYRLPFLDYSADSLCFDKSNFYNSQHLNTRGVNRFNSLLAKDLSAYIPL